jgi:Base plate wedge protein 53
MSNKYFDKFPLISYSNTNVINLTARTSILKSVQKNPYIYYPYDLEGYERADQFANRYYGDSYESWIIYLSNMIIDPVRDWYLSMNDFNELVTEKYGSVGIAAQKTKFYRNNWENVESLMPNGYDALPPILQPYWEPITTGNKITSYKRRQVEWSLNTNRIVEYSLSNTNFIIDEVVNIFFDANHTGSGQVLSINASSNAIYVQHVSGYYQDNVITGVIISDNSYMYGQESMINATFQSTLTVTNDTFIYVGGEIDTETKASIMTQGNSFIRTEDSILIVHGGVNVSFTSAKLIAENLAPDEDAYWGPVSYLDYENEKNEFNKTILVLDKRYAPTIVENLKELLST